MRSNLERNASGIDISKSELPFEITGGKRVAFGTVELRLYSTADPCEKFEGSVVGETFQLTNSGSVHATPVPHEAVPAGEGGKA